MKSGIRRLLAVMLVLCVAAFGGTLTALAEPLRAEISAGIIIEGPAPDPAETYTVRMTADKDTYPMPGNGMGGSYDLTFTGPGNAQFPDMYFDKLGVYTYKIFQTEDSAPTAISRDDTVNELTVYITRENSERGYSLTATLTKEDDPTKPDGCLFVNVYPEPEPTPTVEPTPEPTPKPGPTPEPKLPQTGVVRWPVIAFSAAGCLLIALGVILALKEKRKNGAEK